MSNTDDENRANVPKSGPPAWLWVVGATVAVGLIAVLLATDHPKEPSEAFRYDVKKLGNVDRKAVIFKEVATIPVTVPRPSAMATAPDGRLFVAGEGAIAAYDAAGKETARFPVEDRPTCLAVTASTLLVGLPDHIVVLDLTGKPMAAWPSLGGRACITSVAANDTDVYVADAGNRLVVRYGHDGVERGRIGAPDAARQIDGFVIPSPYFDVAFDAQGALWVVNPGKHSLEQYRPNGDLVTSWSRSGTGADAFCGCCNPIHIAFRQDSSLVTAEKGLSRVKVYAPDNTLRGIVITDAEKIGAVAFGDDTPVRDLAVDVRNRILVLDGVRNSVRVFE